jgi:hypothetical protein
VQPPFQFGAVTLNQRQIRRVSHRQAALGEQFLDIAE